MVPGDYAIGNELRMHALVNRVIRKLLIAVVALSLLGVTPLLANRSVCGTMACCAKTNAVTSIQDLGCCPTVRCAETQQYQKNVLNPSPARTKPAFAVLTSLLAPTLATHLTACVSFVPPGQTSHRRLALLSALLI